MISERCGWTLNHPLMNEYHDHEWGNPLHDDHRWFEFIVLDAFQAGLSWLTILKKRENFRRALDQFDYEKIACYNDKKLAELIQDEGIIRNRLKITGTVTNAKAFIKIREEFGSFDDYIWGFTNGKVVINHFTSMKEIPARTELSDTISKDMKKRGFTFVGSTIVYAFLQAAGIVNDHLRGCYRHPDNQNHDNG
ncbi:MAG TPA: DNA-3-methyladenine glycosylase I [Bacteroidales bacterium]|nr:MAG: DNA-3-methyladenine glycosylase [Bacteroidetes bacterium GWE2_42_24]OFY25514.1 MAG: DNA-3-methyladenine glycosylase [Bacteroidetes bacterium GWF2_43_11]HAQ66091.1 DNA-3-methyladenine glycosylase I [Bacteroidales bacterium]HBZ66359.1 DNA-3-methyladenine glycosylase I [Bacteroidales bacterium]